MKRDAWGALTVDPIHVMLAIALGIAFATSIACYSNLSNRTKAIEEELTALRNDAVLMILPFPRKEKEEHDRL